MRWSGPHQGYDAHVERHLGDKLAILFKKKHTWVVAVGVICLVILGLTKIRSFWGIVAYFF